LGDLPNDVRTHLVASGEQENVLLTKLLLLESDLFNYSQVVGGSK
jgi:hypothetical protein